MRVGVFQFSTNQDIYKNHKKIVEAIKEAGSKEVRLLVFHECAACGYPPIETPSVKEIDFKTLDAQIRDIKELARAYNMYIALGTIRKDKLSYYNCMEMITPTDEVLKAYDKRALWGWDLDHFTRGNNLGIYDIDGIKIGFRICFEIRFPEYFRELFQANVNLCFVSFCDISKNASPQRYNIIKSHLVTRAVENVMTIISVNSISDYQTAPTAVFDENGMILEEAPLNEEYLLVYDYEVPESSFGSKGRIENSNQIIQEHGLNYRSLS